MPFKLEGATESRLCEEKPSKSSEIKSCVACQKVCVDVEFSCVKCSAGCYCSESCRDSHVQDNDHRILCLSIQRLEEMQFNDRLSVLPLREKTQVSVKNKLVRLVGEKPLINCRLNKTCFEALWDTGAMVSMVSQEWLDQHFPSAEVDTLEKFLEGDTLHLFTANNTPVDLLGVVTLSFEVGDYSVRIPFVVSRNPVIQPIIGFNVIQHLIFEGGEESGRLLKLSCPTILDKNISAVVNLIRNEVHHEEFVTTAKKVTVPANCRYKLKCKTAFRASDPEESVLFTPHPMDSELVLDESVTKAKLGRGHVHVVVNNPTNNPIVIGRGVTIGSISSVSAVIPLMPNEVEVPEVTKDV